MQKVKVHRYISGKRPEYAQGSSSEDESDIEDFIDHRKEKVRREDAEQTEELASREQQPEEEDDPRLKRLKAKQLEEEETEDR